jgi:hypothetical protein
VMNNEHSVDIQYSSYVRVVLAGVLLVDEKSSILCEGVVFIVYFGAIRLCGPTVGIACERRMAALSVGAEWPLASDPARHYTTVARSGVTQSRQNSSLQAS